MTPKEKAIELIEKYKEIESFYIHKRIIIMPLPEAKQCALIAVEEVKEAIFWHPYESPNFELEYWNEVINEIEKL